MSRTCDAVVIGGGVIGCAVAGELRKAGVEVVVIEKARVGQEASSAAAGMLTALLDADEDNPFLRLCLQACRTIPDRLSELGERTGLDVACHRVGLIQIARSAEEEARLRRRYDWQKNAGLQVELLDHDSIARLEPSLSASSGSSLYFPGEAYLDSSKYTNALAAGARALGAEIREGEEVLQILTGPAGIEGVQTSRERFHCRTAINAAGAWAGLRPGTPDSWPVLGRSRLPWMDPRNGAFPQRSPPRGADGSPRG